MGADFFEFDISPDWTDFSFGPTGGAEALCEHMIRGGMAMMAELVPGLGRAACGLELPPGATIEIELSLRGRRSG